MSNYEKDLQINKDALDDEWIRQPGVYMRYVQLAAKADSEARRAKEKISVVQAEVSTAIRTEKAKENVKTTEAMLNALVFQHKDYKEAVSDHIEKVEEAKIMNGAVDAFAQRRYALENSVKLYLSGYFSEPKDIKDDEGISQDEKSVKSSGKKQKKKLNDKRSK
jgi:hypothetical protein